MRISQKELENSISKINIEQFIDELEESWLQNNNQHFEAFNDKGESTNNISEYIATKHITKNDTICKITVTINNMPYEPGNNFQKNENLRLSNITAKNPLRMARVTEKAFNLYLSFLATRDSKYLQGVSQGIMNA